MQKIKQFINKHPNWIAAMLLFIMFALAVGSMRGDSAIVDEIAHIPAGYSYLKYGDYRLNPEHPPLLKDLAAVPLMFMNFPPAGGFPENISAWKDDVNGQWEAGWHFIYHAGNNADSIIFWARIPMVLIMLLLGFYLYKATKEWFGQNAALLALALYAFCPNIIAHGRFVTTDVGAAAFMFISIYYFIKWVSPPLEGPACPSASIREAFRAGNDVATSGRGARGGSSYLNVAKASVALALAQLAKFSAALLIPLFLLATVIIAFIKIWKDRKNWCKILSRHINGLLIIFVSAFILIGVFYYPHVKNMPVDKIHAQIAVGLPSEKVAPIKNVLDKMADIPVLRPHAYYLTGFAMVIGRVAGGNTTFFLGKVTNQSFRAYFPIVYLAKTPIATLILIAIAIIASILSSRGVPLAVAEPRYGGARKDDEGSRQMSSERWIVIITLSLFIFIYSYTSITGNLNIGFRHLMPILPLIFALAGYEIAKLSSQCKCKFFGYILAGLLLWLIGANLLVYPHYVAYFNEAAGGINNGYKIVTDSNVDWGQDLRRLKEYIDENKIDNIKVDYFGGGDPKYYFCDLTPVPSLVPPSSVEMGGDSDKIVTLGNTIYDCTNSPYQEWHANNGETTGWIAISATFLQNSLWYKQQFGEQDYQWLREKTPETIIGGSILIYHIE